MTEHFPSSEARHQPLYGINDVVSWEQPDAGSVDVLIFEEPVMYINTKNLFDPQTGSLLYSGVKLFNDGKPLIPFSLFEQEIGRRVRTVDDDEAQLIITQLYNDQLNVAHGSEDDGAALFSLSPEEVAAFLTDYPQ